MTFHAPRRISSPPPIGTTALPHLVRAFHISNHSPVTQTLKPPYWLGFPIGVPSRGIQRRRRTRAPSVRAPHARCGNVVTEVSLVPSLYEPLLKTNRRTASPRYLTDRGTVAPTHRTPNSCKQRIHFTSAVPDLAPCRAPERLQTDIVVHRPFAPKVTLIKNPSLSSMNSVLWKYERASRM